MDDYVSKPIRTDLLLAAIERQLERGEDGVREQAGEQCVEVVDEKEVPTAILDRENAVQRMGGNEALFEKMVNLFLEHVDERIERVSEAIERNDAAGLCASAHKLKGASASVGADRIRDTALCLERIGDSGDLREAPAALERLRREVTLLKENV